MELYVADGLRLISGTHTTVRRLDVVSQLVRLIGSKNLPLSILKLQAEKWSENIAALFPEYKTFRGKLTEEGRPTTAFKHYINLLVEFGLILKFGDTVSLTKLGVLLNLFLKERDELQFKISSKERIFYLYLLFTKDADLILTILGQIIENNQTINQKTIQEDFANALVKRLRGKIEFADVRVKADILEKKRVIEVEWRKPKKYAEHLAVPRLEWLEQIEIIKIHKLGSNTNYSISSLGNEFLKTLLNPSNPDIDEKWIFNNSFSSFSTLFSNIENLKKWEYLSNHEKEDYLSEVLLDAFKTFNLEGAMRMSILQILPYISIRFLTEKGIVIDFSEIANMLTGSFTVEDKSFLYRPSGRMNEGYILVKLKAQ